MLDQSARSTYDEFFQVYNYISLTLRTIKQLGIMSCENANWEILIITQMYPQNENVWDLHVYFHTIQIHVDIMLASVVVKLSPLPLHSPCFLWMRCRSLSRRSIPGSWLPVDSAVSDCCWLCWRGGSWFLRFRRRSFRPSSKLLVLVYNFL